MSFYNFSSKPTGNNIKKNGSSAKDGKTLPVDYIPKRFGLKYDPPTIILEYMLEDSGKLYHHKLKLPHLKENSNSEEILEGLRKKHGNYLVSPITDDQIITLIEKLKSHLKNLQKNSNTGVFQKPGSASTMGSKLGKLEPLGPSKGINKKAAEDDFWTKDFKGSKAMGSEDLYGEEFEEEDLNEVNLNKLDHDQLNKKKAQMDVLFNKNQKKPTDPGFKYDIQEDFDPKYENDWDLEDDDDIV